MIELSYQIIRDPKFKESLGNMLNKQGEPKLTYHLARIGSLLLQHARASERTWMELLAKHADIKDDGTWTVAAEKQEVWASEVQKFFETRLSIDKRKLTMAELEQLCLTANDQIILEEFFDLTEGEVNGTGEIEATLTHTSS